MEFQWRLSPVNSDINSTLQSELNLIKSLNLNYNILNEKFSNIKRTLSSYKIQNNNHADNIKQVIPDKIRNKISSNRKCPEDGYLIENFTSLFYVA